MTEPRTQEGATRAEPPERAAAPPKPVFARRDLLRWLYLGRLTVVTGILAGAFLQWFQVDQQVTLVATVMFLTAVGVTAPSFWYTHLLQREPGQNFLYAQIVLDVLIVTGIVHVTGGPESDFAPLYILVVSSGALLLPLSGGVLIGGLASMVYAADVVLGYQTTFVWGVGLQIGLFTMVALITGLLGDRLRRAGLALGAVESELRQLRLDTGDILATLATGVVTVDGGGRLAYANPAAEALLGFSVGEWLGRPVVDEFDRRAPGLGGALSLALEKGAMVERALASISRSGVEMRLGISTTVLDRGEEQAASATAIFQDITDLERLEALNRRAERLEAVATLSASLAHEIKNPLASIRSAVEQLSRSHLSGEDRGTLERLVLTESDRLSRLLSEFLDYTGLEIGEREVLDLRETAGHCADVARQHPDLQGVSVECSLGDDPVFVAGDADLLHRALFNLVLNGAQAAGAGGRVRIELGLDGGNGARSGLGPERRVRLAVSDSGPGVESEIVDRIFDPFYTTKEQGSGLGLAVVHRAMEAHDGAVLVERETEGGARFVILLPEAQAARRRTE